MNRSTKTGIAVGAATLVAVGTVGAGPANATSQQVQSGPAGHYVVSSSVLSQTDLDGDANRNTATTGDSVTASYAVRNKTTTLKRVTITFTLDAPGTADDTSFSEVEAIGSHQVYRESLTYEVTSDFPLGRYNASVTVSKNTATGTETGTSTVHLQVH
jgi:hypothetical protein